MSGHTLTTRFYFVVSLLVCLSLVTAAAMPAAAAHVSADTADPSADPNTLYRTHITLRQPRDLARAQELGATVLESGEDWALVIVTYDQLTDLARLRFSPGETDSLASLGFGSRAAPLSAAILDAVAYVPMSDDDGDGLSNTLESWWCTDPSNPDSDNDGTNDGDEVYGLKAYLDDPSLPRPATGKPFSGWPPSHPDCDDSDQDSVPDSAEDWLGLNRNRESTDRDKFDDGQELFGNTYCTGAGGFCSYGSLPRDGDWGVIFAEMPSWVHKPYDNPFVAAFPVIEVEMVEDSFRVDRVTVITTQEGEMTQTTNTYETSVTKGTSTSVADTVTWNEWQEVSDTTQAGLAYEPHRQFNKMKNLSSVGIKSWVTDQAKGAWNAARNCFSSVSGEGDTICSRAVEQIDRGNYKVFAQGLVSAGVHTIAALPDAYQAATDANRCPQTTWDRFKCSIKASATTFGDQFYNQLGAPSTKQQESAGLMSGHLIGTDGSIVAVRPIYQMQFPPPAFTPTHTESRGTEHGGAHTTTNTEYEEHTITEGEAFTNGRNWSTAWTTDTVHAADLRFSYRVSNSGADYSREVEQIVFNLYLGGDETPFHTCSLDGPNECNLVNFVNMMPGESHQATAGPIPLTLDEMRRVDLGEPIYVVVEDYSYGIDELFYQDAWNAGVFFAIEDGIGDGNELIDTYLLPTWGTETIQDVLGRYFPTAEDDEGHLLSIWTPEYDPFTLKEHALTDTTWWNIYMADLGDGSQDFQDIPAVPHSVVLFRFNQDTDRDGYGDRSEIKLNTDPNDPADHPNPELLAGAATTCDGSGPGAVCTTLLSFLNTGNYDAYGVEAVMYAPDDTTTIGNNTIGGSGRVRAFSQVVLGTRVMPPAGVGDTWTGSAIPYSGGYYAGDQDKVFTFTAGGSGNVGSGTLTLDWADGAAGASGTLDIGDSYHAPLPLDVAEGLQIGLNTGTVMAGNTFTVEVRLPRDTFTYTIESGSYTPPAIVVSYNDPQGNHRFATPITLTSPVSDLLPYSGQMLEGVELEITTLEPFDPAAPALCAGTCVTNTHYLVINSPHPAAIQDGHLFVEYVDITGTVVAEQVFTTTFQPGPTIFPVEWSTGIFTAPFTTAGDYNLLAFWTDAQGNIIDSAARPLSTFQADPLAEAALSGASWDFGTVTQGMTPETTIALANTGLVPLRAYADSSSAAGLTLAGSRSLTVPPGEFRTLDLTLDTAAVPAGTYSAALTLGASDPNNPQTTVQVTGVVEELTEDALAYPVSVYRPWDQYVFVPGPHDANEVITFAHTVAGDSDRVHPMYVYDEAGSALLGIGEYGLDFSGQASSFGMFGNGSDGPLMVEAGQTIYLDDASPVTSISGFVSSGQMTISVESTSGFSAGDIIMIHQSRGVGAGNWELAEVTRINEDLILNGELEHSYDDGSDEQAQVLGVPQHSTCTINEDGTLTVHDWNGNVGGILAFACSETLTVDGIISTSATDTPGRVSPTTKGYKGGNGGESGISESSHGEGTDGLAAGTGSGGVRGTQSFSPDAGGGGGGGGNGAVGAPGGAAGGGAGGDVAGTTDLSIMVFGGGGGGGDRRTSNDGGGGGGGGGIVVILGKTVTVNGGIESNGGNGGDAGVPGNSGGGGGGAGGSILVRAGETTLGTNLLTATAGNGGSGVGSGGDGGYGGIGRIRIEYCNSLTGTTDPPASMQQITCYIARQLPGRSSTELTLPEAVSDYARYRIQYGLRNTHTLSFTSNLLNVTIPNQDYTAATLDVLLLDTDTPTYTLTLDVGDDGSVDWTASGVFTGPILLNSPDLAAAFNAALGGAVGGETIVPISVSLDTAGDLFLTNLVLTPGPAEDAAVTAGDINFSNSNPTEGDTVIVQATISNTQSLTATHIVAAFFAGDPESDGVYLGADFLPAIPPGGTATAGRDWDTEGFGGDVELYVVLDPAGQVDETDEQQFPFWKLHRREQTVPG